MEPSTHADLSDDQLILAVAQSDREALRALYERHAPWLSLRLDRRCADPGVVAETVQDTFLAVWRGAKRYRGDGEVAAWIWGIGIRRLIGHLRKRVPTPVVDPWSEGGATRPLTATESAEDRVLVGVEHGDLGAALDQLSPELRAVVQATVLDGLTTREAAQLLGIPSGTVKTRMMRARIQLRGALA